MYILQCADGSYYTGSTKYLHLRIQQHQNGEGANYTKKRRPVKLMYYEEFNRIDTAFYREKQVQGWSRKKKEALMNTMPEELKKLAECMNDSHHMKQWRCLRLHSDTSWLLSAPFDFFRLPSTPFDSLRLRSGSAQGTTLGGWAESKPPALWALSLPKPPAVIKVTERSRSDRLCSASYYGNCGGFCAAHFV